MIIYVMIVVDYTLIKKWDFHGRLYSNQRFEQSLCQTYFLLFMNKQQKLGLDSLHSFHSFRSRWRVRNHFFAKYSDVNYFVLYATFNKVMASFITLTLQSRWCVRNISLQSAMTWIILFYMRFLNDFWILFTFNV